MTQVSFLQTDILYTTPDDMNEPILTATEKTSDQPAGQDGEILTVLEVARFLRVPKSTVYKLARLGQLPASKVGKHWRFLRQDVQRWIHGRAQQPSGAGGRHGQGGLATGRP